MDDPYDLERFVKAQDPVLPQVLAELEAGRKRSHWMWFVFPQLAGLGHSAMARHFALGSIEEARAYLAHPLLRPRLLRCTDLAVRVDDRSAFEVFGSPDDMKFRSSMTLFAAAEPAEPLFAEALARFFGGEGDERTLALLRSPSTGVTAPGSAP